MRFRYSILIHEIKTCTHCSPVRSPASTAALPQTSKRSIARQAIPDTAPWHQRSRSGLRGLLAHTPSGGVFVHPPGHPSSDAKRGVQVGATLDKHAWPRQCRRRSVTATVRQQQAAQVKANMVFLSWYPHAQCRLASADSGISQPAVVKAILPGLLAAAVLHGAAAQAGVVLPKSDHKKVGGLRCRQQPKLLATAGLLPFFSKAPCNIN